jgi:hypothetical protein
MKYYGGSTTNLKKRKEEPMLVLKTGYTKLKKAFIEYGYINFAFTILATIRYSNILKNYGLWKTNI